MLARERARQRVRLLPAERGQRGMVDRATVRLPVRLRVPDEHDLDHRASIRNCTAARSATSGRMFSATSRWCAGCTT